MFKYNLIKIPCKITFIWSNAFLVEWSNWWYILPTQQENETGTTFYKVSLALLSCEKVGKKISQEIKKKPLHSY